LVSATHLRGPRRPLRKRRLRPPPKKRRGTSAPGAERAPLWRRPRCGTSLISRGLSHACGPYSVKAFLQGASPHPRALFSRFVELIAACGPYQVAPAKTRVAFLSSVRFASVNRVRPTHMDVHLVLPRPLSSPRFRRVERVGRLYVHHLRLSQAKELNAEVQRWLRQSYREYGQRRWLKKPAEGPRG
jgi:Domain of unknown function (DUF5655)